MMLAKPLRSNPRAIAQQIVDALPASEDVVKVEIAGPGFINFFMDEAANFKVIRDILSQGEHYGRGAPKKSRVQVEFVSANPTGPLHVGHGRGAAYGASVADMLEAAGYTVEREYYVNDAGRQDGHSRHQRLVALPAGLRRKPSPSPAMAIRATILPTTAANYWPSTAR